MSIATFALGKTISGWLWPEGSATPPANHQTLDEFITQFILPHENAYVKGHDGDPAYVIAEHVSGDAGGTTKYGIDAASHPGIDIEALSREKAVTIYKTEFAAVHWNIAGALPPALTEFPFPAAFAFFDCRENCGLHAAWICLQRAMGLDADGIPGPLTRNAVLGAPGRTLTATMIDERVKYHQLIAQNNPQNKQFLQGWLNRCSDLRNYLNKLVIDPKKGSVSV